MKRRRSSVATVLDEQGGIRNLLSKIDVNNYKQHKTRVKLFSTELMESVVSGSLNVGCLPPSSVERHAHSLTGAKVTWPNKLASVL
jgi:hypothetical protein